MTKYASIDIGTNTLRLLIADCMNGKIKPLHRHLIITRLGEGLDKTGLIKKNAKERTKNALKIFNKEIIEHKVSKTFCVGTSALRDAKNKTEFLKEVKKECGIRIKVISGKKEGELTTLGVFSGKIKPEKNNLIIDIGGGSTEFIFCRRNTPLYIKSLNIGSVRFTERFFTTHPVKNVEIIKAQEEINRHLKKLIKMVSKHNPSTIIGVAGTVTTLYTIYKQMSKYIPSKIDGRVLPKKDLERIVFELSKMSVERRKRVVGMDPGRADVIVAGGLILLSILEMYHFKKIHISDRDILFGILANEISL